MLATVHTTRVLVANGTGATLYLGHGTGTPLQVSREIEQPEGRGREAGMFAQRLIDELEHERIQGGFERLAVVAPAKFLGEIKGFMPGILRCMLVATVDKDMRGSPSEEIRDQLSEKALI
jgi:protein required for attachment to host cells